MATFSKQILSGSTSGKQIAITQTATLGTTIHTAHATDLDEIWVYATNIDASAVELTVEWGGATVADQKILTINPKEGDTLVISGLILTGGLVVTAFAGSASKINISGYVNRIT